MSTPQRQEAYRPTRRELANAIRFLCMDAVQRAKSGHPGAPMGMADIAEVLWNDYLRHNPANPRWPDRDRFVMSNGHGSMLLYSLLHLTGYPLSVDDLKAFRRLHSKTPGHPEYGETPGVENTTGPLGQGLANAVGMAIAERSRSFTADRDCRYQPTGIGASDRWPDSSGWFTNDVAGRFAAYRWHVVPAIDGHDPAAITKAIDAARAVTDRPSLLVCRTVIGWPAPTKGGTEKAHGAPLGREEVIQTRVLLGWPYPEFVVPEEIYAAWDATGRGQQYEDRVERALRRAIGVPIPSSRQNSNGVCHRELPAEWHATVQAFVESSCGEDARIAAQWAARQPGGKDPRMATRKASRRCLNAYAPFLPELLGGSADLTESNCTDWAWIEGALQRHARRQLHRLWRARVRHVGHHERPRPARRVPPLWRDIPGVLRLRP